MKQMLYLGWRKIPASGIEEFGGAEIFISKYLYKNEKVQDLLFLQENPLEF